MREIYIDEFGRPVSPTMAAQYSPPHEHMVPSYPLPPVLPYPPSAAPKTPPYNHQNGPGGFGDVPPFPPQLMPHPSFFPVFFGQPGFIPGPGSPPGPTGNYMGMGVSQPPMWYQAPEGGMPPFTQVSCPQLCVVEIADSIATGPKCRLCSHLPYPPHSISRTHDCPIHETGC